MAYFEPGSSIVTSLPLHGVANTKRGGADHFLPPPAVMLNFLGRTRPGIRTGKCYRARYVMTNRAGYLMAS